ncbi:MAG: URC4/urg3 family protein [Rubrivivax sp.]
MSELFQVLRDPATIRLRCAAITQAVAEDRSGWWTLDRSALADAAGRVAALTRERFPEGRIPFHSRWRHFEAGGVDRKAELEAVLAGRPAAEHARAMFDLTVVSVLLDAGAGAAWKYREGERDYTRSEGLGVASFRAFMAGRFSADAADPLRVDAAALRRLDSGALREIFQVAAGNPLVGLEGRAGLLQRLGAALQAEGATDGTPARPALLFDRVTMGGVQEVSAAALLGAVLKAFAPIWTSGSIIVGMPAGDVWPHRFAGDAARGGRDVTTAGWVPFHKLSQWLTYSLLEPLTWAGFPVTGLEALTGLPEYRNGGLFVDCGVLTPRDARAGQRKWKPADEFVVEWRALTVTLLDELALLVRDLLGKSATELPLACVLEGGSWAAGRRVAAEKREGGAPPFTIESDGTIF